MKSILRFLLASLWLVAGIVCAKDVTVQWDDTNTEGVVSYFEISWVNPNYPYSSPIQVPRVSTTTQYTITGLNAGHFTVRVRACPVNWTTYPRCSDYATLTTKIPSSTSKPTLSDP